jgi:LuxR family maltose regulon positive regulatory protein
MIVPSNALASRAWSRHQLPARPPVTLPRVAVQQLLDESVEENPVTLVSAPSGFGKTTAVAGWAESSSHYVAWLTITASEEDSVDRAIVGAIESAVPKERLVQADPFGLVTENQTVELHHRLQAALSGMLDPFVLVVDDAQRATESLASGLLGGLIESTPAALRIVLVGTTALELQMPRFILSNPEAVIGAEVLAFDLDEVKALAKAMESSANPEAVHAETAGWPIAVRLAMLTPRGTRASARSGATLMHEYVRDVVLSGLDPKLARFVMEAAVCDELTPALAAELTGNPEGGRMLETCRRLGLFLDRADGPDGPQYRWHGLFARQCREVLGEEQPERLRDLRERAATLLAGTRPLQAVELRLAIGDPEGAEQVILQSWVSLLVVGSAAALDRACLLLPAGRSESPVIQLVRACARDVIGEHRAARELFEVAEPAASTDAATERVSEIARLFFRDRREDIGDALTAVRARLRGEAFAPPTEHAAIIFLLAWTEMRYRIDPQRTLETLEAAVREAEAIGDRLLARRAQGLLAYGLVWAGRNTQVRRLLASLEQPGPDANSWVTYLGGGAEVATGLLAYWSHDLARAEQELRSVLLFSGPRSMFADLARVLLALVAAATGDPRQCRRAALELQFLPRTEVQGVDWPRFRHIAVALLEEAVGHRDRAVQLARGIAQDGATMPLVSVLAAGILRRAGAHSEAVAVLKTLQAFAAVSYVRVSLLLTTAVGHYANQRLDTAHSLCEEALAVAELEDVRSPFCDDDPELRELLGAHVAWGTAHEEFLLSCLRPGADDAASPLKILSERERDVFEQLRSTLTTVEIADRLGVSVNTVKTHQRSIYRKLGVTSRREALRRYT